MRELELPEEIMATRLRGEEPEAVVAVLDHVLTVVQARCRNLAQRGLNKWDGPKTVVVIAPSSEVFSGDYRAVELAQVLARIGRAAGVALRLIDAAPPLFPGDDVKPPFWPLNVMGSVILREFVTAPEIEDVTFHQLSPREMVELAENG